MIPIVLLVALGQAAVPTGVPQPIGSPATWIGADDYPVAAMAAGHAGPVAVRLEIGRDGVPSSCVVTRSSGYTELDVGTCAVFMRRARFHPMLDEHEQPRTFAFDTRVAWVLPEPVRIDPVTHDFAIYTVWRFDRFGRPTGCEIHSDGPPPNPFLMPGPCEHYAPAPATDEMQPLANRGGEIVHRLTLRFGDRPITSRLPDGADLFRQVDARLEIAADGQLIACRESPIGGVSACSMFAGVRFRVARDGRPYSATAQLRLTRRTGITP